MHLLVREPHGIDAQEEAVDLAQGPADIVFLSFSDSDLGAMAAAHGKRAGKARLRMANLAQLKHPFSVDLYLEKTVAHARVVIVRCLGGADYWRYGIDQLAALCRAKNTMLALVPGCTQADGRLDEASTLPTDELRSIWRYFDEGGPDNIGRLLDHVEILARGGHAGERLPETPMIVPVAGRCEAACREGEGARALIVLYRSLHLAADIAPIVALADVLAERGCAVEALFVSSLKDARAQPVVADTIRSFRPDIVLNTTAFSARDGAGAGVLDGADRPVIQAPLATISREAWNASSRGLGAVDLAMNVVLPEVDGRIVASPISFKTQAADASRLVHGAHVEGIDAVADLALGWARLRRTPPAERRVALILSDYPLKGGREGYAVGLDAIASVEAIAAAIRGAGYAVGDMPSGRDLVGRLATRSVALPLRAYRALLAALPADLVRSVTQAWGPPDADPACREGALRLAVIEAGTLLVALQPDRGSRASRREDCHDPALPPRHAYLAFYLWLRHLWRMDAMIHLGTHGTLEWLPGKAVALSPQCAPAALVGGTPVIYPFIVNDPGEAAQARRRIGAVTIGHMTPPLAPVEAGDAVAEIEALLDEYSQAGGLDPRRASLVADAVLARATETGLAAESGIGPDTPREDALTKLDAWLCDLKDLRLGDGLHVFGRDAPGEVEGLLAALDGRFVEPGPAGAPSRARQDVLPTGRNLFCIDPRAVPTRTALAIGSRTADAVLARYLQDHGDWPRALMMDLWGSATMRTGGEDFAQALCLMGVRPLWDAASSRVSGFEILSPAELGRPRIDVTVRVSGLFRDTFPAQMALFDQAARAVSALDEDGEANPLAAARREAGGAEPRVFAPAPGAYGNGIADLVMADPMIDRMALAQSYLDASSHAFTVRGDRPDPDGFARRVGQADALLHVQDMAETDVLAGSAFAEEEGGFAAAAAKLGGAARVYHVDATREDARIRTLAEEVARVGRAKFGGRTWIEGLMRHGHRGAGEIAEAVSNLAAFAVTADCVSDATFDLAFDATLGDDAVRAFLERENPGAARSVARDLAMVRERGLWSSRRNSVAAILDDAREAA